MKRHEKLGNGISEREDGGSKVILTVSKDVGGSLLLAARCLVHRLALVTCAMHCNSFLCNCFDQRLVKQQKVAFLPRCMQHR